MQFANPQEARDFLAAHPQVRSIELMLIDANGIPHGKLLHRDELLAIYQKATRGMCWCAPLTGSRPPVTTR